MQIGAVDITAALHTRVIFGNFGMKFSAAASKRGLLFVVVSGIKDGA